MISAAWNFLASLRNDRLTLSENPLNAVMALKERATQKMKTIACFEDRNSCLNRKGRCMIASVVVHGSKVQGFKVAFIAPDSNFDVYARVQPPLPHAKAEDRSAIGIYLTDLPCSFGPRDLQFCPCL